MKINKKLLPVKGHYLLFNAGTAPLVPYLSTYARQLGFSSATVGLIYTVLPIFGLIAKPLFGIIADRFKAQKSLFIIFQIVTIVSFGAIYFIPSSNVQDVSVMLGCGDGVTVLRSCYKSFDMVDTCKVDTLGNTEATSLCHMNCNMNNSKIWQTVCEHWHIPQYCYNATDAINYSFNVSRVSVQEDCSYVEADKVVLDGLKFTPHCSIGDGYLDINEPCSIICNNTALSTAINNQKLNMTCLNKNLSLRSCSNNTNFSNLTSNKFAGYCEADCALDKGSPWRLMEICEGWQADAASTCKPKTLLGDEFPSNLSFVGHVPLAKTIAEHECVYMQLKEIVLPDGAIHYPTCLSSVQYQTETEEFHTSCSITCDNQLVNELIGSAYESRIETNNEYSQQFWLFFLFMIISWVGQAVVVSIADAICFNLLGDNASYYGKQRLWGSVGFGIFSLLTGTLVDYFSEGTYRDYTIAFIFMLVFLSGDVAVSCFIKQHPTKLSVNIIADVWRLAESLDIIIFLIWTVLVGLCTGLIWNFLYWLLEDVAALDCNVVAYGKTLQGLVSAIQTFGGEIPFMFISGGIIKKLGHNNVMSLVLFAYGIRFILYSYLSNAWLILPIEIFQGLTIGMIYPTMASYANLVSLPGTETTVQGLTGAIFEGVGTSLGSFIAGRLYDAHGGWYTFRWFGIAALVGSALHFAVCYVFRDRLHTNGPQGYSSVIRFDQNDTIQIMDDMAGVDIDRYDDT